MSEIISINRHYLTYNVDWHSHDYLEIIYCTKGSGYIELKSGEIFKYRKNDFIIIPRKTMHRNMSDTGFENIFLMSSYNRFSVAQCAVTADTQAHTIHNLMSQAYFIFNSPDLFDFDIMSGISDLLFNCIVMINRSLRLPEKIEYIRSVIIRMYGDPTFNIRKIMYEGTHITETDQKQFKRETGMTLLQFLTKTRLDNAKRLLLRRRDLNLNITEIAKMCGYEDVLYFSRAFKKHFGTSPINYTPDTGSN